MSRNALLGLLIAVVVAAIAFAYGFYGNEILGLRKDQPQLGDSSGPSRQE
jgi:hypothetical protein